MVRVSVSQGGLVFLRGMIYSVLGSTLHVAVGPLVVALGSRVVLGLLPVALDELLVASSCALLVVSGVIRYWLGGQVPDE